MVMRVLDVPDIHKESVEAFGLDGEALDLLSAEAIACSIRRAAGFLCPCPQRTLVHAVVEAARHLVEDIREYQDLVSNAAETLVAHGDLIELKPNPDDDSSLGGVLVYLAAPAFVVRDSGALMVIGVAPDDVPVVPSDTASEIDYVNHSRVIRSDASEEISDILKENGLIEVSIEGWLKLPSQESAPDHYSRILQLLSESGEAGDLPGLAVITHDSDVAYYPGRWAPPDGLSGVYVGRRSQAFGANLWCVVELIDGRAVKVLDLPLKRSAWRGCDEAWRFQSAIDWVNQSPQRLSVREGRDEHCVLDFYSPLPMWARRRLDAVGYPTPPNNCLLSYGLDKKELREEVEFLNDHVWLQVDSFPECLT